ncbi:MAG: hypothetical protein ACE5OY_07585 [Candidatus Bathyarchaeia archaeon]
MSEDIQLLVLLKLGKLKEATAEQIARETNLWLPLVKWILSEYVRKGYVEKSEEGTFSVTPNVVKEFTLPEMNREEAEKFLRQVSEDEAFRFSRNLEEPLDVSARSMKDLIDKLGVVDIESVRYHVQERHFGKWIRDVLGDVDLADELDELGDLEVPLTRLRLKVLELLQWRYETLQAIVTLS